MSSLPIREQDAYLAEILLKRSKYDLFLFIEDEKLKLMYEIIINKLFDKSIKIGKIFSMKSKGNVLEKFEEWKKIEGKTYNKVIFIVDRDFDHLIKKQIPSHVNLIELEYYTIENYLISKPGALLLMKHRDHDYDSEELEERLNWEEWESFTFSKFENLFLSYAMAFKHDLGQNCSISPHRYLEATGYNIKEHEIEKYINSVKSLYETKFVENPDDELAHIKNNFTVNQQIQYHQLISGKYLLEALIKYINSLTSNSIVDKNLIKTALLNEYPEDNLIFLKNRITNIVSK